jgi:hypothetical protein
MPTMSFYTKEDNENKKYGIILTWVDADGYFGEIKLISDKSYFKLYTENLSKQNVKSMLEQIIDESEIMD